MNKQGIGKIDWTDWTWNPISGCLHKCNYCYLRRMPVSMKPTFHKERLKEIGRLKNGALKIFVGSSGDMFGEWVPEKWIWTVLETIALYPEYIFQFLTKNPERYSQFSYPLNCWLGATVDTCERAKKFTAQLYRLSSLKRKRFISAEPLSEDIADFINYKAIDWIIIGGNSNRGVKPPPDEWADKIIKNAKKFDIPIWMKDNYKYHTRIKEFPA